MNLYTIFTSGERVLIPAERRACQGLAFRPTPAETGRKQRAAAAIR